MISPKQSSCLSNINDYNIKEFTTRDETRILSFPKKEVTIYDCINNSNKKVIPANYDFDKWGRFNEK
jgi:hypothetical protein